jgi:Ser/Thr protein kinase RdoA (MazF antagonist)
LDHPLLAAQRFTPSGQVLDIKPYGRGNVHDTFLVTLPDPEEPHFILQRLNTRVFRRPQLVLDNLRIITAHLDRRRPGLQLGPGRRWQIPRLRLTTDGGDHFIDPSGGFWRALSFIEKAQSFDTITDPEHAGEVGYALGMFHLLLSDLPPGQLADTLPGFHVTPAYLRHYDEVRARAGAGFASPEMSYAAEFVAARRDWAAVLEEAKARGDLKLRVIHGDPKVNNVMMDTATGKAVGLVDLDTVKPGLVHYDLGDCLRSGCNPLGEDPRDWEAVRFHPELARAILGGYLPLARDFLTEADYAYLGEAIRLLPFELGLRFFTDYLAGNIYFKTRDPEHNLRRALVQFRLTASIEAQAGALEAIIRDLR